MDRRQFIKVTAATGASATLTSCGNPENQLIRFIPEEELMPGISVMKPSICPLCPAGCGLLVRVMEGEAEVIRNGQPGLMKMGLAKKLEGNPAHPINHGKLCVRGQAAIQGSRCLKHLIKARERQRTKRGLKRRYYNTLSYRLENVT